MKTKYLKLICLVFFGSLVSCNKDNLTDLNKPINAVNYPIPANMFTGALLNTPRDNYSVLAQGMQYFSTYKEVPAIGDKFYSFNGTEADFVGTYTVKLNLLHQLEVALEPTQVNEQSMVRILRVYTYHQLTDVAGDIPYFDAVKGDDEKILSPKYDTQRDIYLDMLKELDESTAALDPAGTNFGNADLFYKGDVTKWKKFAYTLMLRLAMRLTNVEPGLAEEWVRKAIAGGVMTDDGDIAKISYANVSGGMNLKIQNSFLNGNYLNPQDIDNVEGGKYAATFINELKETNDPRLPVMSVVWQKPSGATAYVANNDPDVQRGMVSGSLNTKPVDFDTYSEPSPIVLNVAAPIVIMGPSEAYLLLAEAALRGWYAGSTAKETYDLGVKAGMTQWALWPSIAPGSSVITQQQSDDYLAANPYNAGGSFDEQLEQISVQKWICLFGDDYEVYANWRRTGYPELMPVNYPGNVTGGKMFRRFSIPIAENLTNQANYLDALERQGFTESTGDNLLGRVWWDKP
ncbi:MAG: SusD/RagB family nutrient-binding outer membrane lipoprotein [Chitinophagaceae bacterium]|nr:SusD/RagB family nutrient-binding outer membrane lipoprotein [Chitinophagaceae bacterium]